ncbi:MAG: ribose 5-phosphate isomerase B [Nitrospirae bacterium]|nr:ribose 5-phosphate isomerase B [Nitrospirota bacterium]
MDDNAAKIAIASDHAGLDLKEKIVKLLRELGRPVADFGTHNHDSVDYPDYGIQVARAVSEGKNERGILICGTGIGMSIVANKFPGVRAALCYDPFTAKVSRLHNDANILVLGERVLEEKTALEIVRLWLSTGFDGGRHARRLAKIEEIEKAERRTKE